MGKKKFYGNLNEGEHLIPDNCEGQPVHYANVEDGKLFRRGDSFFVKVKGREAVCVNSGHDCDERGETYEFGDSVPVLLVEMEDEDCGCCGG